MLKSVEAIGAKDHAEAIAVFRAQVIAPLCVGKLARGERAELLFRAERADVCAARSGHQPLLRSAHDRALAFSRVALYAER